MENFKELSIVWSDYIKYKTKLRKFKLTVIENILRYSRERYFDTITRRRIAVGKHDKLLVLVPYEINNNTISPITIHATTRKQISFRLKTGRFVYG